MDFTMILSVDKNGILGCKNEIAYNKEDKEMFRTVTRGFGSNILIAGRKTYESLPSSMINCNSRYCIKMSRSGSGFTFEGIIELIREMGFRKNFVIGGKEIYELFLSQNLITKIYLTRFECEFDRYEEDTQINLDLDRFKLEYFISHPNQKVKYMNKEYDCDVTFMKYKLKYDRFEYKYLSLVQQIDNRILNRSFTINLADGFPILTIRKVFFRGIVEELLWFISGSTNTNDLKQKGVNIWNFNSSRKYLDDHGFIYLQEGDIGAGYGFQLKHNGEVYFNCRTEYKGFDQLNYVIDQLKNNPTSRRILINLWNPSQLDDMVLPPCHILYHFIIDDGKLNCHLYQRSWDILLGWNTSTAALLTHLIAHHLNIDVGTLAHTVGDIHIYNNNTDKVEEMLKRTPYLLPKLKISNRRDKLEDYVSDDFKLMNYKHHDKIDFILN